MKLEKDLNEYNRKELLDIVFSFVEEEALEENELREILNLSDEELKKMVKELIKIDEEGGTCDCECRHDDVPDKDDLEIMASQLALNEEMIRQENLYDKEFDVSEETKGTELYKDMVIMAESVVAGLRILMDGGIDYSNALQLCSNQIQNKQNLELTKYNYVVNQGQNQI